VRCILLSQNYRLVRELISLLRYKVWSWSFQWSCQSCWRSDLGSNRLIHYWLPWLINITWLLLIVDSSVIFVEDLESALRTFELRWSLFQALLWSRLKVRYSFAFREIRSFTNLQVRDTVIHTNSTMIGALLISLTIVCLPQLSRRPVAKSRFSIR
jgi:hypothetical protein